MFDKTFAELFPKVFCQCLGNSLFLGGFLIVYIVVVAIRIFPGDPPGGLETSS